jgi:hypothetical protein
VTLYQDQIAHAEDIRAVFYTNMKFDKPPLLLVDREGPWLWLGWDGPVEGDALTLAKISLSEWEGGFHVESCPPDSLAVPFRDSIRNQFSAFIRMRRPTKEDA